MTRRVERRFRVILLDTESRMTTVEGYVEGMLAQGRESAQKLDEVLAKLDRVIAQNRQLADHVLRLLRQKEALLEMVGRVTLEHDIQIHTHTGDPNFSNFRREQNAHQG